MLGLLLKRSTYTLNDAEVLPALTPWQEFELLAKCTSNPATSLSCQTAELRNRILARGPQEGVPRQEVEVTLAQHCPRLNPR
jgi:hypothetical protein